MNTKLVLIIILLVGLLIRIINIESSPPSLYGDELTIALDAESLLKTGHDQLGNLFPLTFPMGAGRPAGYVYISVPFIAIFGPTALGVRSLSILSGLGVIILLYYIGRKLFSDKVGLCASIIAVLSPWDISLSRGGFEAHFALFLALLGFYLFIKAKEKPLFYILSALSFGLTLHTYPTYKVTLPLFLPLVIWFENSKDILKKNSRNYLLISLMIIFILGAISVSQTFIGGSETRFSNINIFSQEEIKEKLIQKINYERQITDLPGNTSRYFHNKIVEYTKILGENYLQNFSADFLFIHGDRNPRHNMATIGQFYFIESLLIILGLITFWQKERKKILFLILWILLAPIPTAIVDLPHALRSSFMLPSLIIFSALGLVTILNMKNKLLSAVISLVFLIQFTFFIQKLYFLSPNEYSNFWSYSAKQASEIAIQNKNRFDYVIVSDKIDSLEFAYPVYAKVDPFLIISQNKNRVSLGAYQFKKFDNVYIGSIPYEEIDNFITNLNGKILFIGEPIASKFIKNYETMKGKNDLAALVLLKKEN